MWGSWCGADRPGIGVLGWLLVMLGVLVRPLCSLQGPTPGLLLLWGGGLGSGEEEAAWTTLAETATGAMAEWGCWKGFSSTTDSAPGDRGGLGLIVRGEAGQLAGQGGQLVQGVIHYQIMVMVVSKPGAPVLTCPTLVIIGLLAKRTETTQCPSSSYVLT